MNRDRYIGPFNRTSLPAWRCPSCAEGSLKLVPKSLFIKETVRSLSYHRHENWEPDWTEANYSALLKCFHCDEHVFSVGKTQPVEAYDDEHGLYLESALKPLYFQPPIQIIPIPDECPHDVKTELISASSLFWSDLSASANRIRTALELILTHKKINKTKLTNSRKRRILSLHERIELFKVKDPQLAEIMLAVKWLGNAGSHTGSLNTNNVLEAFELLDHVIEHLFVKKLKRLRELTKGINKKKGPGSSK
ncbi:DUF4145 domain-containing protein [Kangiella koreensis]|uniref:DUF4145 domain-containing protein n=1 Tax=Kangiella koreensis (strain DSM 16069 / JCM 12317 / KCTC 12182 / SW-125) TaxID=523791 RepID=C7R659_KANKD|nr:DUF4145 domain-containing protein [Kangiella koreensis]ACV25490.1 conserved hypothetical protein [Kangiella koreensis DSM 16069]